MVVQKVEERLGEIVKVLGMGHRPRTNASVHDNIKWLLEIQGPVLESECTVQQVPYRRLPHTLFPPAYLAHCLLALPCSCTGAQDGRHSSEECGRSCNGVAGQDDQ